MSLSFSAQTYPPGQPWQAGDYILVRISGITASSPHDMVTFYLSSSQGTFYDPGKVLLTGSTTTTLTDACTGTSKSNPYYGKPFVKGQPNLGTYVDFFFKPSGSSGSYSCQITGVPWDSNSSGSSKVGQLYLCEAYGPVTVTVSVAPATCPQVSAAFTVSKNNPYVNETITFVNQASDAGKAVGTCSWNFGDGTTATGWVVSHSWGTTGSKTVTCTTTNSCPGGTGGTYSGLINVIAQAECTTGATQCVNNRIRQCVNGQWQDTSTICGVVNPPIASIYASPRNGYAPLSVNFTDQSSGVSTRQWNFGDGQTSTAVDVVHTYTSPGTYTVTLTVSNSGGTASATVVITVLQSACTTGQTKCEGGIQYICSGGQWSQAGSCGGPAPVANFSATPASGKAPLTVSFADQSTGSPSMWMWSFGDTVTSTLQNPSHTYVIAGTYTVTLYVSNTTGSNTISKTITVTTPDVPPPGGLVANFTVAPTRGAAPLTISVTDTSTPYASIVSRTWDFGDGATSTNQVTTHTYTKDGSYTVRLTVVDSTGAYKTKYTTVVVGGGLLGFEIPSWVWYGAAGVGALAAGGVVLSAFLKRRDEL